MSSSTTTSIFTFDHGQKKLNKAIGVEESYLEDLATQMSNLLKDYIFDKNGNIKDDLSPSMLTEMCLHEFSYSQLVIIAGFYMQNKLDGFAKHMEDKVGDLKKTVKRIALDSDDIPDEIKDFLINLVENGQGNSETNSINGEDLPKEVRDFLDNLAKESDDDKKD